MKLNQNLYLNELFTHIFPKLVKLSDFHVYLFGIVYVYIGVWLCVKHKSYLFLIWLFCIFQCFNSCRVSLIWLYAIIGLLKIFFVVIGTVL